jgi:outer membrane lipoprotein-sorting protein
MKKVVFAAVTAALASLASATESTPRSDVEARLDALETMNITAQKPVREDDAAPDAELDAILQAAARADAAADATD